MDAFVETRGSGSTTERAAFWLLEIRGFLSCMMVQVGSSSRDWQGIGCLGRLVQQRGQDLPRLLDLALVLWALQSLDLILDHWPLKPRIWQEELAG